jgi:hypothetical protein
MAELRTLANSYSCAGSHVHSQPSDSFLEAATDGDVESSFESWHTEC